MRTFAGHLRGLTLLLGSMATSVTTASDFPYSQDGPCGVQPGAFYTVLADCANVRHPHRKLRVTVTLPAHPSETISSQRNRTAPYPVVVFFSGFLVRLCAIADTCTQLAWLCGDVLSTAAETSLLQCICQPLSDLGLCMCTI